MSEAPDSSSRRENEELVDTLAAEQHARWHKGERTPAEEYLQGHPGLAADPEAACELIFNEYILRQDLNDRPRLCSCSLTAVLAAPANSSVSFA